VQKETYGDIWIEASDGVVETVPLVVEELK
jgi:hypothetical protein